MAAERKPGMKFKSSAGSMEAVGSVDEADDVQEDSETPKKSKKKDNTLLLVGVAALALMALRGR